MRIFIFFSLFFISVGYFCYEVFLRYRYTKLGKPESRTDNPLRRWRHLYESLILQRNRDYPILGVFHGFIMWGFVFLLLSTFEMATSGLFQTHLPLLGNSSLYLFLRDTFIFFVMIGVIGFGLRRMFFKPNWLHNSFTAYGILLLIFAIVFSELIYAATQVSLGEHLFPGGAWFVLIVSKQLSYFSTNVLQMIKEFSWWFHFLAIFSFLFIIPLTKHLHLAFAPFNVYWASLKPKGSIFPVSLDQEKEQTCGVKTIEDFTSKQLFDAFSCVKCGRCHGYCPSEQSGERVKPKKINGRLRSEMEEKGRMLLNANNTDLPLVSSKIVGELFHNDFIWGCTTCGGCNEVCPVSVDHLSKFIDMRRAIISENKDIPPKMKEVFINIEKFGNPLGIERHNLALNWIKELKLPTFMENPGAEYLFFIGCQATFDKSSQKAAVAFAKILQTAGVNFAVLDEREWCCGETVRRMGNELLFQKTVTKNIADWNTLGIKKIITTCPHCFNTFKNEYSQFGGDYEVIPHTVFLANLLREGKLTTLHGKDSKITYHDPCYLGRYNDIYNEPRIMISAISGTTLTEMPRSKEISFCCGAGGGRFWTREIEENPISINRFHQVLDTGAEIIITSCPYCHTIFQDEILKNNLNENIITMDIAEFIQSCL